MWPVRLYYVLWCKTASRHTHSLALSGSTPYNSSKVLSSAIPSSKSHGLLCTGSQVTPICINTRRLSYVTTASSDMAGIDREGWEGERKQYYSERMGKRKRDCVRKVGEKTAEAKAAYTGRQIGNVFQTAHSERLEAMPIPSPSFNKHLQTAAHPHLIYKHPKKKSGIYVGEPLKPLGEQLQHARPIITVARRTPSTASELWQPLLPTG